MAENNSYIFNFNRVPKACLLAILMIFVFEILNAAFDDYFYSPPILWGLRIKTKAELVCERGNNFDMLVLGDSYNTYGIIPKEIYGKTGLSCYNFSMYSPESPFISYCALKDYLNRCAKKPRFIIIGYLQPPDGYARPKNCAIDELNYNTFFIGKNMFLFVKEFGILPVLKTVIPSLRHQDALRKMFSYKFSDKKLIEAVAKEISFYNGYQPYKNDEIYTGRADMWRDLPRYKVGPLFLKYMKCFLTLACDNNIKVIYLIPSEFSDRYKDSVNRGIVRQYSSLLRLLKKEFPEMIVWGAQDLLNKKELYSDCIHLNRKGALLLSDYLSENIKEIQSENKRTGRGLVN